MHAESERPVVDHVEDIVQRDTGRFKLNGEDQGLAGIHAVVHSRIGIRRELGARGSETDFFPPGRFLGLASIENAVPALPPMESICNSKPPPEFSK